MTGAVGGVLREIPPTALQPVIIATEATSNVLGGMRNQLLPDRKREDEDKWKREESWASWDCVAKRSRHPIFPLFFLIKLILMSSHNRHYVLSVLVCVVMPNSLYRKGGHSSAYWVTLGVPKLLNLLSSIVNPLSHYTDGWLNAESLVTPAAR